MFEHFIYNYGIHILALIVCGIAGTLGFGVKKIYQASVNDETKQAIAHLAVQFVEQIWKALHGPEKLQKALETAEVMLKKKGIDFDAEEMTILIEAAVAEFNEAFKKPLLDEASAGGTYRVDETEGSNGEDVVVCGLAGERNE